MKHLKKEHDNGEFLEVGAGGDKYGDGGMGGDMSGGSGNGIYSGPYCGGSMGARSSYDIHS